MDKRMVMGIAIIAVIAIAAGLVYTGMVSAPSGPGSPSGELPDGVSTFQMADGDMQTTADGRPIVYMFSTTTCPHCIWVGPTFEKVAQEYEDKGLIKAYHWELDIGDDALTAGKEPTIPDEHFAVYSSFNPKFTVPTFVFGGRYYRIGNGYESSHDLAAEEAEFRAVIDALLDEANHAA